MTVPVGEKLLSSLVMTQESNHLPSIRLGNTDFHLHLNGNDSHDSVVICTECLISLRRKAIPKFCIQNYMFVEKVPPELLKLMVAEELLVIAAAAPEVQTMGRVNKV